MGFNIYAIEMAPFGPFVAFITGCVAFYIIVAEIEDNPLEEMANPQGMKMFAIKRHELPEDFVYFCAQCGV